MAKNPSPDRTIANIIVGMIGVTFGGLGLVLIGHRYGVGTAILAIVLPTAAWLLWRTRTDWMEFVQSWRRRTAARRDAAFRDRLNERFGTPASRDKRVGRGTPRERMTFYGLGSLLETGRGTLGSPLVYATRGFAETDQEPSVIEGALPAAPPGTPPDEELPYWPSYRGCSPAQRAYYLDWLLGGRSAPDVPIGYVFIYYYGLERRALVDGADLRVVFDEVRRLQGIYCPASARRSSFRNYSTAFLWFLAASDPESVEGEQVRSLAQLTRTWTEEKLAAALAWFAQRNAPLPVWMAYIAAEESANARRSVVIKRVNEEFRTLFAKRYQDRYGNGVQLRTSKRPRKAEYQSASAALGTATLTIPNVLGIPSQFKPLAEIWNDCIDDLRKLSSVARTEGRERLTAAGWEALPPEIRSSVDHPCNDAICDFFIANTDDEGRVFVRAGELARVADLPEDERLTPRQGRQLADTVEHVGFGIEPDARLTGKAYEADELLAVFPMAYEGEVEPKRYGGAACLLRLGVAVAEADGRIDDEELNQVTEHIEAGFDLNEHEQRRLEALRSVLLQTGSDVSGLGKRLKQALRKPQRASVGRLLVAVAATDGVISKSELKALRRCYRALGLEPELLDETLTELAPTADEAPVTVLPGRPRPPGEAIPKPKAVDTGVQLDRQKIARIMHETREVSVLLADAMNVDAEVSETAAPEPEPLPETTVAESDEVTAVTTANANVEPSEPPASDAVPGPPERYAAFYEDLISKNHWTRDGADALARSHGHMLGGAIEAINEWAFEALGDQLVYDEEDGVMVEQELLEAES